MSNESMRRDAWKIIRKTLKEAMPDQAVEKALRARIAKEKFPAAKF